MSKHQTFPDVIAYNDGHLRLVTQAARSWTYSNTSLGDHVTQATVPRWIQSSDPGVVEDMEHAGLVVTRGRCPTNQQIEVPGPAKEGPCNDSADEFDRHRARFMGMPLEEYRRQIEKFRAYGRHRAENHRLMQEAAEKRKSQDGLQDEQTVE